MISVSAGQCSSVTISDVSAALHLELAKRRPLVLLVHSGGTSLHGWYYVYGSSERQLFEFMRYAYQLGLPTTFMFGQSYASPTLTALELLPTVTFYGANTEPHGASRVTRAPLFSLESHLTRTLGSTFWVSADLLYRSSGATTTEVPSRTVSVAAPR